LEITYLYNSLGLILMSTWCLQHVWP
jgi:hypothetical protein